MTGPLYNTVMDLDNGSDRFARLLIEEQAGLNPYLCMGCSSCSAACPASGLFDMDPQKFIRLLILGQEQEILNSRWLWICAMCRACVSSCPFSIDIPLIINHARMLQRPDALPRQLQALVSMTSITGNSPGKSPSWFLSVVEGVESALRTQPGLAGLTIPVDQKAEILLVMNMNLLLKKPSVLGSYARIFHNAGQSWTISSFPFDSSCPAFLAGDRAGQRLWQQRIEAVCNDLEIKSCIIDDCSNPFTSFGPKNTASFIPMPSFDIKNSCELIFDYLEQGRINLHSSIMDATVTLHDLCNVQNLQELYDFPRTLLEFFASDFIELGCSKRDSICCGGTLLAAGLEDKAVEFGKWKADQIKQSGADTVIVLCESCYMQIEKLIHSYHLPCKVAFLPEVVADALKTQKQTN